MQKIPFSNDVRETLNKRRFSIGGDHYFFELKKALNQSKYIVISQRRKVDGKFVGKSLRLFEDEMLEFQRQFKLHCEKVVHPPTDLPSSRTHPYTISKSRYFTTSHNYFFEVSIAVNDSPYVTIDQRKKVDGNWIGTKINVFGEALAEFQTMLKHFIEEAHGTSIAKSNIVAQPIQMAFPKPSANRLHPQFFAELLTVDWQQFERDTATLLKLLGIHNVHPFHEQEQAGRADGFFSSGDLAVLYDCTLAAHKIDEHKSEQINNYCNLLRSGRIEISADTIEDFSQCHQRQVWIITRNQTQRLRSISRIEVKEIAVQNLIELYERRLTTNISLLDLNYALAQL